MAGVAASTITRTIGSVPLARTSALEGEGRALVCHNGILIGYGHVLEQLRIDLDRTRELGELLALGNEDLHETKARHDAVTSLLEVAEDDVAALLAAQGEAVLAHAGVDEAIAHGGLLVVEAGGVERAEQAEVAHDGGHHGLAREAAVLVEVGAAHVEDEVAVDHVAALVHRQTAIGVTVIGKAHVQAVLHHEVLQALDVGGAAVHVDVEAVGGVVDDVRLGAQGVKDRTGHRACRAIGAVEANLVALQRESAAGNQAGDVAVTALHVVHRAADGILGGQRHLTLAVDVVLDQLEDLLVHLVALVVNELDAIVGIGVVARGDHDAAIEPAVHNLVAHARRGDDMQHVGVGTAGHEAAHER